MSTVFIAILAYIAAQLLIGLWVSRRINTESDYLIAGRKMGYGLSVFSLFATWFGAETCMGAAGAVYAGGLSGSVVDPLGFGLCLLAMGLFFAVPLWSRSRVTLGDLFRERYSPGVERVAVLMLAPASVMWAAAQIRAFGQVLSASSGFSVELCIAIATGVVILYTTTGGLMADAVTDVVQGTALVVGLTVLTLTVAGEAGGILEAAAAVPPDRRRFGGPDGPSWIGLTEIFAITICGSVMTQEIVGRVLAARSPLVARRASLLAAGSYWIIGTMPVFLGLVGFTLLPGLEDPEQILPRLAQKHLPVALYVVFTGALISAILSTVDSALLSASSLISHNLIVSWRPGMSDRARLRLSRSGVVVLGIAAYLISRQAGGIYDLVKEASAFGSAGVFVAAAMGLYRRRTQPRSGYAALSAGMTAWIVGAYIVRWPFPYLISLAAALAAFGLAAVFSSGGTEKERVRAGS
jgi:Na+/proline symporter